MLSTLFKKDYAALTARGIKVELADVIRLNALALRAKEAEMPSFGVPMRRVVYLDGFALREPTIAHELWLESVAPHFDLANDRVFAFVYAFALSREAVALPSATNAARCVRKVFAFAKKRLVCLTGAALNEALEYALFGLDWTACEFAPEPKPRKDEPPRRKTSPMLGVLAGMRARRLNVSLDDAKQMTVAELCDLTLRTDFRDGKYDAKAEHVAALKDYYRALAEVKEKGKPEDGR